MTKESKPNEKHHTLDRAVQHIIAQNDVLAQQLRGPNVFTKPTGSPKTNIGASMSTRKAFALYADVPTVSESGSASTTATPQGQCEDFSVQLAIGMSLVISETTQRRWNELLSTSEHHLRYRC